MKAAIDGIRSRVDVVGNELNELDGRLGDGDLGVTLINGFNNMAKVADQLPSDVGMSLFACAKAVTQVSGSSFGTLMAIALMAAGKQAKGRDAVPWSEVPDLVQSGLDAMIARGGAALGDKTVLDAMDAIVNATRGLDEPDAMLRAARQATDQAVEDFKNKACRVGRARIFGDRTIGMDDPGMIAVDRMLGCLETERV